MTDGSGRVYRYRFPWLTVFSVFGLFAMLFLPMVNPSYRGGPGPILSVFGPVSGLTCAAILIPVLASWINGRVVISPERIRIVNGLRRVSFDAAWCDVEKLEFAGDYGGSEGSFLGNHRVYRIQASGRTSRLHSNLQEWSSVVDDLRRYYPPSTELFGKG